MKRGLDWYKREPRAIIDGIRKARLTCRQAAIYNLILDLIYEGGGETPDAPHYVAGHFADIGVAAARRTIQELVDMGKLLREGGMLSNRRAKNEAKTREKLSENRAKIGRIGGVSSGNSRRKHNRINAPCEANASTKHEAEIEREKKERDANASPKKDTRLPADWVLSREWGEWAVSQGLPVDRVKVEAEKFRDHWHAAPSSRARKADWFATWRNWCRKAIADMPKHSPKRSNADERFARLMDSARRRDERREAEQRLADGPDQGSLVPFLPPGGQRGGGGNGSGGLVGRSERPAAGGYREGDAGDYSFTVPAAAYAWRGQG